MGYVDELTARLKWCKQRARKAGNPADQELWKERAIRVGLLIASQLIEMNVRSPNTPREAIVDRHSRNTQALSTSSNP